MTARRSAALGALVAFAAALAVFTLLARGGGSPPRSEPVGGLPLARPGAPTGERIAALQAAVRADSRRADGWTLLAGAYLQRARENGDVGLYARAEDALRRALALSPGDAGALTQRGALALARHDFRAGLHDALRARRAAPEVVKPFGVLVDALVELGRYGDARRALQAMVDRKPDLAAYARVSYFRELHGDLEGAVEAMRLAASAGGEAAENVAYVQALLGGLELQRGRPRAARRAYRRAQADVPEHLPAEAGLARVDAAAGRLDAAVRRLRRVVDRLPLPEYVIALGEAEIAAGRRAAGRRTLELVSAQRRLLDRGGVNADVELALFEADHGSPRRGVELARRAWSAAPSVRSADALGWALTRAGGPAEGLRWARRALRLGSRDAGFLLHAGIAAARAGRPALARRWLADAGGRPGALGPLQARVARRALEGLG
jgi:tetratricopeptide (TPR) repeat protein